MRDLDSALPASPTRIVSSIACFERRALVAHVRGVDAAGIAGDAASTMSSGVAAYVPGTYCRPVENPTAPSAIARQTSDRIFVSSGIVGSRLSVPIAARRTVLWPMNVAKLTDGARLLDLGQRFADVERRAAAVAGHDRRHAHADEVLGARMIRQVVGVRVHVDESGRDDEVGGVDGLARASRGLTLPMAAIRPRGNRHVGLALRRAGSVHDTTADDGHVVPRSREGAWARVAGSRKTGTLTFLRRGQRKS